MSTVFRALLILVFFFAAIACYVFGAPVGGALFIVFGALCEVLFWVGIFGTKNDEKTTLM